MYFPKPVISLLILFITLGSLFVFFWPEKGLISQWKRIGQMRTRILHEDTLKYIHKCELKQTSLTLQSIAGTLGVSINRATEIISQLENYEFVCVENGIISLTTGGREYALRIIRAHRLWERHLAENTGFLETDWHNQAEYHEHFITAEEADNLASNLGHPTHDPHGDPIPTQAGELVPHKGQPLPQFPLDTPIRIVHLEDEPALIYEQLIAERLYPGMEVRITENSSHRIKFWSNGEEHILAPLLANNISAVPIKKPAAQTPGFPLTSLERGEKGRIIQLSRSLRGPERRRLMDLGLLPGTEITAEMSSPSGDPIAYRFRNTLIALRHEQSNLIKIEKI